MDKLLMKLEKPYFGSISGPYLVQKPLNKIFRKKVFQDSFKPLCYGNFMLRTEKILRVNFS